jgi:CRISPR-associated protein Cmr3
MQLSPHDPLIARDGRPFGIDQGQRMRGLPWPLPSVVAGSFRTALVKADPSLDFSGEMPQRLLAIDVAGVFPVHNAELYLPAPNDALGEPAVNSKEIEVLHRLTPQPSDGGCDFPGDLPLQPVMLPDVVEDFKPAGIPAWWPTAKFAEWLTSTQTEFSPDWLTSQFLNAATQELRDHVCLEPERGAAAEGRIFATAGLSARHLPRFGVKHDEGNVPFDERFANVTLSARVQMPGSESNFKHVDNFNTWHPLGGERRLVHWHRNGAATLWTCPAKVKQGLDRAFRIRMVLATPAIFNGGWKPGWLNGQLEGSPPGSNVKLKLVGVSNSRWKAVSGWSLAKINHKGQLDPQGKPGPKAIRRLVPAGSVYFFKSSEGDAGALADRWLHSVSDDDQEKRDGFGLAVWGTW